MRTTQPCRRLLFAIFALGASLGAAEAHHPGSHATRQPDGRVKLEAVATTADACARIADIRIGTPVGVAAPPGSVPVTARLLRESDVCAVAVAAVRSEATLDLPNPAAQISLYFEGADGRVLSTERVPIR